MKKTFIILTLFTLTSFALSYVCAAIGGDLPYPSTTFKGVEEKLNEGLVQIDEKQSFNSDRLKSVELKVGLADLTVAKSPDEKIHFHLSGAVSEQKPLKAKLEGDALELRVEAKSRFRWLMSGDNVSIGKSTLKAVLMIPANFMGKIDIKVGAGDVSVSKLVLNSLAIKLGKGDVTLKPITAERVEIQTGNGDVDVKLGDLNHWRTEVSLGYGEITTDFGDGQSSSHTNLYKMGAGAQLLEIKTGKGNVSLSL